MIFTIRWKLLFAGLTVALLLKDYKTGVIRTSKNSGPLYRHTQMCAYLRIMEENWVAMRTTIYTTINTRRRSTSHCSILPGTGFYNAMTEYDTLRRTKG